METQSSDFHPLFEDVQLQQIFPDGKTFVDCTPRTPPAEITAAYKLQKDTPGFDLAKFVHQHFELPTVYGAGYQTDKKQSAQEHVEALWDVLTRQPDGKTGSLIPLPFPYIVPGGRFGEIYYWDSYFTMLGLKASGRNELLENMVKNFSYLIDLIGYIPNGNRTYYFGRSQPPFYSLMIRLLMEVRGPNAGTDHLPQLEKEYAYWMRGAMDVLHSGVSTNSVVRMPGGELLNRYWDENDSPRAEAYREDVELSNCVSDKATLYRHLRAGAASGWDFSSRWFREPSAFATTHTTDIIAVDLNCLLFLLEEMLAELYTINRHGPLSQKYRELAAARKRAVQRYCWNEEERFFFDYDISTHTQTTARTVAAAYTLFAGIASREQADAVAEILEKDFLQDGGLVTTLETTGQQWDAPNGWAPLQWVAIAGLKRYGHGMLAAKIANRWMALNEEVYNRTGKFMEKYNVIDTHLDAGGGEYAGQDGFGWTNGVYAALKALQKGG